jgi:hypothetical protein
MGLLTALLNNVRERRQAELAFALNQREEAEAQSRMKEAEDARLWHSVGSDFGQQLAEPWSKRGGGEPWSPPDFPSTYSSRASRAPEPPAMQPQAAAPQGGDHKWANILDRMKSTSSRMGSLPSTNRAPSPLNRVR